MHDGLLLGLRLASPTLIIIGSLVGPFFDWRTVAGMYLGAWMDLLLYVWLKDRQS